jgi:hypothetical protein
MTTPVVQDGQVKTSRKRAADHTGRLNEKLQLEHATELKEAAARVALATQAAEEEKNVVVDYTNSNEPIPEVEIKAVQVSSPFRMIRVNQNIDQMTYGREVLDPGDYTTNPPRPAIMGPMKYYSFEEGVVYRVSKDVADHLNDLGYLSYMSGA